jgi:glycosyltransferase involved in cell wall biosynthesis
MPFSEVFRVGFVLKRYPRYSETFVVREILAHEEAGLSVEIFSLRPPDDAHFQDLISRVRAPANYLYMPAEGLLPESLAGATLTAAHFWKAIAEGSAELPGLVGRLEEIPESAARDVYQGLQLARAVRRKNIHHLHSPFASDAATVARLASHFSGVPYSFTARAKDIFHEDVEPDDLSRKLRDAAGVVTVSDYHLNYLRQTYGTLADKVQRIYNGLNLEEYPFQTPLDRPPVVIAVGRLIEKKGFGDLIDACALLRERGRPFHCRIIGTGNLQAELTGQISRLGLTGQVQLIGPLRQTDVVKEMQNAAVLAVPCIIAKDGDRDGLPNVIQEALALGLPVVATDVTGIPEVIQNNRTGFLVPQRDPQVLAKAIEQLLQDPGLGVRLATEGRRLIEAEFNIRRNTQRRRDLFRTSANGSIAKTPRVAGSFPTPPVPSPDRGEAGERLEALETQEVG